MPSKESVDMFGTGCFSQQVSYIKMKHCGLVQPLPKKYINHFHIPECSDETTILNSRAARYPIVYLYSVQYLIAINDLKLCLHKPSPMSLVTDITERQGLQDNHSSKCSRFCSQPVEIRSHPSHFIPDRTSGLNLCPLSFLASVLPTRPVTDMTDTVHKGGENRTS